MQIMSGDDYNQYCHECRRKTVVVSDHSAGDTICSECGLVLEARSIDETSEWRCFANESTDNDPVRVGGPINPLLSGSGLSTVIAKGKGTRSAAQQFGKLQNQVGTDHDRALIQAFSKIANMADRLGLVNTIKDRANELYKRLDEKSTKNRTNQDAILVACLYMACRQENTPRTLKEMSTVAIGVIKKDISRAKTYIEKQLEVHLGTTMEPMGSIHAVDFVKRFCSTLGINPNTVKTIQQLVQKCEEVDIRRSPISIVAAAIYMITQRSDNKKPLQDIAMATGVGIYTIKCVAKVIEDKFIGSQAKG